MANADLSNTAEANKHRPRGGETGVASYHDLCPRVVSAGASSSSFIIGVALLCQPHSNMGAMVGMISVLSW